MLPPSACGGEITSARGRFASPSYPDSYPPSSQCEWRLDGSPGNRVALSFSAFDLEDSEGCNRDYVEVHRGAADGPLVGHFCGGEVPGNLTVGEALWVKFNSDDSGTGAGFVAEYALRKFRKQHLCVVQYLDNMIKEESFGQSTATS